MPPADNEQEQNGFWNKHADKILAAAVLAIAGGAVTVRDMVREHDRAILAIEETSHANSEHIRELERDFAAHTAWGKQWVLGATRRLEDCESRLRIKERGGN